MNELLTTDEAAAYLRLSERKLYELVAQGAVPCSKATGRWLFPKASLDQWVKAGLGPAAMPAPAPPIVGGSHGCGLASLPEGSESGLRRLSRGEVIAAAIHLHRLHGEDEGANPEAVAKSPGLNDAVLIAFARREQGLLVAPGNPLGISDLAAAAKAGARIAQRPDGAGAQLLLLALMAQSGLTTETLALTRPPCPTGPDVAQAVRSGRADAGIATRSVAQTAGLDFVTLLWERFDLAIRQRDYFRAGPQALFGFLRNRAFAERAAELGGYDIAECGAVRQLN